MKLQEYFSQKRDVTLSDIQKIDAYHLVMHKQMKRTFQKKRSFLHVKSFVYTSFLLFFLFGFYGVYFFQQDTAEERNGYMLSHLSNTNVAQADFIAKIVDFDGSFYIEQDGKTIQTNNIKDGDVVILKENTQVVFHIDNETKAKIIGPAKFVINKKAQGKYKVSLLYGEYLEMASLQKQNNYNIELSVDDIVVSQGETKKPLNFQMLKQGKNHIIKNNGAKLFVSSNDKKGKTSLGNKQVLAIQGNDISLFDSFEKFAKAVKNNNLSQTFNLTERSTESSTNGSGANNDNLKELAIDEILNVDEQNVPEVSVPLENLADDQKIATPDQTKVMEAQLNKSFLQENLSQLVAAYKNGNTADFSKSFAELERRVSSISKAFQYEYNTAKGSPQEKIITIINSADQLEEHIKKNYLLPPKYTEMLKSINQSLLTLKALPFNDVASASGGAIDTHKTL